MCKEVKIATYQKEKDGNVYCGDCYFYKEGNDEFVCIIVDGLGSGKMAAESAQVVIDTFQNDVSMSDCALVRACVEQLLGKRGVVLGVLRLNFTTGKYTYSSIGNIGLMVTENHRRRKRTIPKPGFLGGYVRTLKTVQGWLEKDMCFLMFSDGVSDQELSQLCHINESVDEVIQAFSHIGDVVREDDTTLIAIKYTGKQF